MKFLRTLIIAVLVFIAVGFLGCSGGGKSASIQGVANIHSDTTRPRVGIVTLDIYDNFVTAAGARMDRAQNGWEDVGFSVALPDTTNNSAYMIVIYNDKNNNNIYDDDNEEMLGVYQYFLIWSEQYSLWRIVDENGNVEFDNAEKCRADDIFIDCLYKRNPINKISIEKKNKLKISIDKHQKGIIQ